MKGMFVRSILVGADGSESGLRAAECAAREAVYRGCGLTVLAVYDDTLDDAVSRWPSDMMEKDAVQAARTAEERVRQIGPDLDLDVRVVTGSPAEVLLAQAEDTDLLVVGIRGRGGFPGMSIGSVAYQVAAHAPGCVLVVGPEEMDPEASEIVVGVDGSPHADSAVVAALRTASHHGDKVRAVWAWTPSKLSSTVTRSWAHGDEELEEQHKALDEVLEPHLADFPDVEVIRQVVRAQPMAALLASAGNARMIAVGARGTRGFARLALGGVAHALLHHAPCPVLVAHRT